ncbi:MAG: hypothetical protein V1761_00825 [bacterium]
MLINVRKSPLFVILVAFASFATGAFGIWHFFIPEQWNWYSYMSPDAPELVVAVRAVNVFFSLSLVLIGGADLLIILVGTDRFARIIMLMLSVILWTVRVLMQIIAPQGSAMPALQYGMLAGFSIIWACFIIALMLEYLSTSTAKRPSVSKRNT